MAGMSSLAPSTSSVSRLDQVTCNIQHTATAAYVTKLLCVRSCNPGWGRCQ
jgi:hypothetical protein